MGYPMSKVVGIVASFFHVLPGVIAGPLPTGNMLQVVMIVVLFDLVLRFGELPINQMVRAARKPGEDH